MATTGERIKQVRERLGMKQEDLATKADLSKSFLSEVENNKRSIGSDGLLRIANVLGASLDYLVRGETGESRQQRDKEPVTIPPALSRAAEDLGLSYSQTLELLDANRSIIARRSQQTTKEPTVQAWKELHAAIKKAFG
jgi:transcriptional regulator with XRE-family HTH domain